jgi:hypothetical protein
MSDIPGDATSLVTWFVFVFEFGKLEVRQKIDSQNFGDKIRH